MSIYAWLAAFSFAVSLWVARRIYSKVKAGARTPGRGTLLFSIAISVLAWPAFQFVIVKSFIGSETGWLFDATELLVTFAIFFNLFFSSQLLGLLSKIPQDGRAEAAGANDQSPA